MQSSYLKRFIFIIRVNLDLVTSLIFQKRKLHKLDSFKIKANNQVSEYFS